MADPTTTNSVLKSYTITKGSCAGTTINLERISPFLVRDLQAAFPEPKPPLNRVEVAPEDFQMVSNPLDPDYQKELANHRLLLSEKMIELVAIRGIKCPFGDPQRTEVRELREAMASIGVSLNKSDKIVYIKYLLLEDADELRTVTSLVYTNSVPTEAAITENQDLFRTEDSE